MSLPDLDPTRSPKQLLDDIADYVAKATALVEARDTVTLAGLDTAVEALCKRIVNAPVGEGKAYADQLEGLLKAIDELQKKMVALQDEVATAIKSLGTQQKASKAYQSASDSAPSTKSES